MLDHASLVRGKTIEASRDEGVQRLRYVEVVEAPHQAKDLAVALERSAVEEHAHRFDRIERNAVGAIANLGANVVGKAGDEAVQQLVHRVVGQRLER